MTLRRSTPAGRLGLLLWAGSACFACATSPPPEPSSPETEAAPEETADVAPADDTGEGDAVATTESWEGEAEATEQAAGAESAEPDTRTMDVIRKVVLNHRDKVRKCYDDARKELPDLKGDMTIHFVISASGAVKSAELNLERSTLKAPAVANCAIDVIKTIEFPPSSRGMESTVNYPFNFKP